MHHFLCIERKFLTVQQQATAAQPQQQQQQQHSTTDPAQGILAVSQVTPTCYLCSIRAPLHSHYCANRCQTEPVHSFLVLRLLRASYMRDRVTA